VGRPPIHISGYATVLPNGKLVNAFVCHFTGLNYDSVKQYVTTCHDCQLRSRPKMLDRVPIAMITRVDVPFQVLNLDCIGPIEPPSAQWH